MPRAILIQMCFISCGERTTSAVPFSRTQVSYHKLVCFQSQVANNLFSTLFSLVFSVQRSISPEASTYSNSVCLWLLLRELGRYKMGKFQLVALGLGRGKESFKHLSGYTASTQHCCKYIISEVPYTSKILISWTGIALQNHSIKPPLTEKRWDGC